MENQSNGSEGICVGVRMRPLNTREINSGQDMVCKCDNKEVTLCKSGQASETYEYDKVFDEKSSTADVYAHIGKKVVEGVASGINGTIFAYGQTSSGKTHTMLGSDSQKGILEMAAAEIFNQITASSDRKFGMKVSFVEIYNESIRDLLYEGKGGNNKTDKKNVNVNNKKSSVEEPKTVEIREDPVRGVYVEATEHIIEQFSDIMAALKKGLEKRTVQATNMNETSSRSHSIFKLQLESEAEDGTRLISALNLVDLAGSESAKNTGASGQTAIEGGKINQSLLSLSRVIEALSMNAKHVGFRDSKLTRLLQPSLSGNAKMAIICCITPARDYLEETKSTLLFAQGARRVKTHARVNEVMDDSVLLKRLTKELDALKQEKQRSGVEDEQARVIAKLNQALADKDSRIKRLNAHLFKNGLQLPTEEVQPTVEPSESASSRVSFEPPTASEVRNKKRRAFSLCPSLANKEAMAAATAANAAAAAGGRNIDADILFHRHSATSAVASTSVDEEEDESEVMLGGCDSSNDRSSLDSDCSTIPDNSLDHSTEDDEGLEMDLDPMEEEEEAAEVPIAPAPAVVIDDSKIHAIEQRIQALLNQFANKEQVIAEKNRTIDELSHKLHEFESGEHSSEELSSVKDSLSAAESRLTESESQVEELQREKQILAQQLEENAAASQELEVELSEKNAALIAEVTALKEALAQSQQALEQETDAALETNELLNTKQQALDAVHETHTATLSEMDALGEELNSALTSVSTVTAELNQARLEVESLKAALSSTQSELEETKQMFDSLMNEKSEMDVSSELQEELSALKSAMAGVTGEKEQLTAEKMQLQKQLEETMTGLIALNTDMTEMQEHFTAQLAEMKASVEKAEQEKTAVSEQLEAELESGLTLQQELLALQSALSEMTAERDALKESEQSLTEKLAEVMAESEEMKSHKAMLMDELHSTKEELASAQQLVDSLQQDKTALAAMDTFEAERQQMSEQLASAEATRQELLQDKKQLEEEVVCFEDTLKAVEEKCAELESDVQQKTAEISRLNEIIAQLESDKAQMEVTPTVNAEETQAEMEQLKEKCTEMDGKCSDLSEQLTSEKSRVVSLLNEMAVAEVLKAKADSALMEANEAHDQHCTALNAHIATQQSTIGSLEAQLAELNKTLASSEEKLKQLTAAAAASGGSVKASVNAMTRFNESEISQVTLDAVRRDNERSIETMRAELGQRDAEVSKLRGVITEWQGRAQVAEQSLAQNAHREVMSMDGDEAMRKRLGQLQTTVDLLKGERDTIAARLASVEQENKTRQNHDIVHIENLERRISDLMAKQQQSGGFNASAGGSASDSSKELQEVNQRLRKAKDECSMLNSEVLSQGKVVDQLTSEVSDLKQKLHQAQSALSATESVEEYVEQVNCLQTELTEARNDLEAANNSIASLEESIAELNAECENLTSQVTQSQTALQTAEEEKAELAAQIAGLTEELDLGKQTEDELVKQLEELRQMPTESETVTPVADVPSDVPAAVEDTSAMLEEMEQLKGQLTEAYQTTDDLTAQLTALKTEGESVVSGLNQRISDLVEELELLKESEAELDMQLEEANKQLQEREPAGEDTSKFTEEISELNEELEMFRQREQEMESKLDSVIRLKSAQQSIIDSLEAQVSNSADQITQLNDLNGVLTSQLSEITGQFDQSQESEKLLNAEILQLKTTIVEQEDLMADMENEVFQLKQELASAQSSSETEEELQSVLEAKELLEQHLAAATEELNIQKERYQQNEDIIQSLQEQIDVKDKRIQHLDTCKLTKDQMEKIKVMKEERKKYQEDVKMLKKQLQQLKVAYDEQKANASSSSSSSKNGPSTDYVISDLKFQIVEVTQQLTQEQKITTLLKDKMKECAKQLQDYENERSAVIELLEKHGIDTVGLMASLDTSLTSSDDVASRSTLEQQVELVDAVSKLAEKLVSVQAALEKRETSKANKSAHLEETVKSLSVEVEELRTAKQIFEKRMESMKTAAKLAKEESSALMVETESLRKTIEEMKAEVSCAEKKVAQSSSDVSSEIQVLEEENIELMKENKDLRMELTRLRVTATTTAPATNVAVASTPAVIVTSTASVAVDEPSKEATVGQKRTFGTDLSNSSGSSSSSNSNSSTVKVEKPRLSALLSSQGGSGTGITTAAAATETTSATPKAAKVARTRAKPVVEDTAECNQQ